jgi:hypothetical protein
MLISQEAGIPRQKARRLCGCRLLFPRERLPPLMFVVPLEQQYRQRTPGMGRQKPPERHLKPKGRYTGGEQPTDKEHIPVTHFMVSYLFSSSLEVLSGRGEDSAHPPSCPDVIL